MPPAREKAMQRVVHHIDDHSSRIFTLLTKLYEFDPRVKCLRDHVELRVLKKQCNNCFVHHRFLLICSLFDEVIYLFFFVACLLELDFESESVAAELISAHYHITLGLQQSDLS